MNFTTIKQKIKFLLIWSQKYTKTDMLYLASGSFWVVIGKIFLSLSAMILSIAFANLLPSETFGIYKYVISLSGIVVAFSLNGYAQALVQAIAKGYQGMLKVGFKLQLKYSIFIVLASLTLAIYYFIKDNYFLGMSALLLAIFVPLQQSSNLYKSYLTGEKKFKENTIYDIITKIIFVASLLTTILLTKNILLILIVYFLNTSLVPLFFYRYTIYKEKPNDNKDETTTSLAKHLSIINFLGVAIKHFDKILVFHYLGAVELAIYSFAIMPVEQIADLLRSIIRQLGSPKISLKNITEIKKTISYKNLIIFFTAIIIGITYVLIAPYAYNLIFPKYTAAVVYSQFYTLSLIVLPTILYSQTLILHAYKKYLYTINLSSNILKLVLLIILIPKYNIWGVIIAVVTVSYFNSLITYILFKKTK